MRGGESGTEKGCSMEVVGLVVLGIVAIGYGAVTLLLTTAASVFDILGSVESFVFSVAYSLGVLHIMTGFFLIYAANKDGDWVRTGYIVFLSVACLTLGVTRYMNVRLNGKELQPVTSLLFIATSVTLMLYLLFTHF